MSKKMSLELPEICDVKMESKVENHCFQAKFQAPSFLQMLQLTNTSLVLGTITPTLTQLELENHRTVGSIKH